MNSEERYRVPAPRVAHETIDDEVVIIEFQSGSYYSLDNIGADIWGLISKGASLDEILDTISIRYHGNREQINAGVKKLIKDLMKEELIVPDNQEIKARPSPPPEMENPSPKDKLEFRTPELKKYTDMQELLLLDPIHEVDETGWPNVKKNLADKE